MKALFGLVFILILLGGCSSGDGPAAATDTSASTDPNDSNNITVPDDNTNGGDTGGNDTPVDPQPGDPQPGDIVQVSQGEAHATYLNPGDPIPPGYGEPGGPPGPGPEPGSDTFDPIIAIMQTPEATINTNSADLELWVADNDQGSGIDHTECSIDGGAFQNCDLNPSFNNLDDGVHTVVAHTEDRDGNVSGDVSYTFEVDTIKPTVQIVSAPGNPSAAQQSEFQFSGSDSGSGIKAYECSLDGQGYQACQSSVSYSQLSEANHSFAVRAVDHAGNYSDPAEHWWVIDVSGPTITFVKQPNSEIFVGENGVLKFQVNDDSGLGAITCSLNGQSQACSVGVDISIPATAEQNYIFSVMAEDAVGNSSTASVQWSASNQFVDKLTNFSVNGDRPVDVLFVVDNSGSMDDERANLAQRIDGFIDKVDGLDWQIAVISTDVTTADNKSDGQFIELIGSPGNYILDANMDTNLAQQIFGNTVQGFGGGSGNEEGIYATKRAIDRYIAGESGHQQFFRDGADLSVVVLSDEDENSEGTNIRITPTNFVSFVDTTWNSQKNFTFHSIITRPGDTACLNAQSFAFEGDIYDELSRLTGFGEVGGAIIGSVCEADYTAQLADIGQSVKDRQNTIALDCQAQDTNNSGQPNIVVSYKAEGSGSFTVYNGARQLQGLSLVFDALLPPGEYKVDYQCLAN